MIPKGIIKQIKYIEIRTTQLVDAMFGGQYESAFKGHGMEFAEVREYYPGDDIRSIDWNVTARTGFPHVKVFHDERELTVFFAVDVSSSFLFGSEQKLKSEIAAELCAVLAFSAIRNNDKIGLLMFSDTIEKYIPIKKGKQHVLRVVRDILYHKVEHKGTNLQLGFETLNNVLTRKAVVFVISDFIDKDYELSLKILARNNDVIAINIFDPRERTMPSVGYVELEDAETGETMFLNTKSEAFREQYQKAAAENAYAKNHLFNSKGIDKIDIDITQSYVKPLRAFFESRKKRS
ncbi:MAG: DUF58 domain-containing protein [Candidatus Omnitrophica bacterium]|nr:DUF58 domain-containing protein [Candidatus Omnitrophota bacterium]